eukprot:3691707-Rhodomonas_salina.2
MMMPQRVKQRPRSKKIEKVGIEDCLGKPRVKLVHGRDPRPSVERRGSTVTSESRVKPEPEGRGLRVERRRSKIGIRESGATALGFRRQVGGLHGLKS